MPPLPTISLTPVCRMNSRSNFSMRMLVVGPMETISNLPSASLRTIGPAWKMAPPFRSTGSSRFSSMSRRCATSRQVTMWPVR